METSNLSNLTNEELLQKKKKANSNKIINAVLIGLMIGIAIFSTAKKGFGFFTIFPIIFVLILVKQKPEDKELENELKLRNLK